MNASDTEHPQPSADPAPFELRDDNLRLLFSEAAKRDLLERLHAIEKGVVVLAMAVLLSITAWVFRLAATEPETGTPLIESLLRFDGAQNFVISTGLLTAAVVAVLSPLIFGMLSVERRRCRREMKDLNALLKRYGRV